MSNKVYDIFKDIALIGIPALATLIATLGVIWNIPSTDKIVLTVNAIGVFMGAFIKTSNNKYKKSNKKEGE